MKVSCDSSTNVPKSQPKADIAEIKRALSVLFIPGDVIEMRALDVVGKVHAGYFNDLDKLANAAAKLSGKAAGVYVVLNQLNPDLLARSQNRITLSPKNLTQDVDITRRRWLPIDADAKRPSGISSTDQEHAAALSTAKSIKGYLVGLGFPQDSILSGDSGNGAHVLARIDVADDTEGEAMIKACLKAVAAKFDSNEVTIDQSVYNAARIWKLPGTLARKGDNTNDRPHRIARLLDVPATMTIAPAEAVMALAALAPEPEARRQTSSRTYQGQPFDLEAWLAKSGIEVKSAGPYEGGTRYILKTCPFNPDHSGTSAAVFKTADGAIGFKCQHASCADKTWKDLRELREPRYKNRQGLFDSTYAPPSDAQTKLAVPWPAPLAAEAFHGLAGVVVRTIEPHTEADPAALLTNFLLAFGNCVGPGPHARAEADRHSCNLNTVQVGETSKGRKGSAWGHIRELFNRVDPKWTEQRIASGLSSGEGLIWEVRDPIEQMVKGEIEVVDEGMTDKRFLFPP